MNKAPPWLKPSHGVCGKEVMRLTTTPSCIPMVINGEFYYHAVTYTDERDVVIKGQKIKIKMAHWRR